MSIGPPQPEDAIPQDGRLRAQPQQQQQQQSVYVVIVPESHCESVPETIPELLLLLWVLLHKLWLATPASHL
jgi:hypothetical protein